MSCPVIEQQVGWPAIVGGEIGCGIAPALIGLFILTEKDVEQLFQEIDVIKAPKNKVDVK